MPSNIIETVFLNLFTFINFTFFTPSKSIVFAFGLVYLTKLIGYFYQSCYTKGIVFPVALSGGLTFRLHYVSSKRRINLRTFDNRILTLWKGFDLFTLEILMKKQSSQISTLYLKKASAFNWTKNTFHEWGIKIYFESIAYNLGIVNNLAS
mgnify:CR=1 FL=1